MTVRLAFGDGRALAREVAQGTIDVARRRDAGSLARQRDAGADGGEQVHGRAPRRGGVLNPASLRRATRAPPPRAWACGPPGTRRARLRPRDAWRAPWRPGRGPRRGPYS